MTNPDARAVEIAGDELRQAIEAELATYNIADRDCPARKKKLGAEPCPRCKAGPRDGCALDIGGAYRFIAAVRSILESQ